MTAHKYATIRRLLCAALILLMLPLAAVTAAAESYNFAKGQDIEADNNYYPPEGFFDVSFLVDGEWLTIEGDNLKLGWNSDPFSGIGETDPVEITVKLDTYYLLEKILLYPMKWTNGEAFPRDFELLGSVDGEEWFAVYEAQKDVTAAAADNVSVTPKEYVLETPVSIRYFRLRITRHSAVVDATGAATSALGEIELYGSKDTAAEEEAARKLTEARNAATEELKSYRAGKDNKDYREAQIAELDATLAKGLEAVEAAQSEDAVTVAVGAAKNALDAVKTDAQLTAEETEAPTEAPTEPETEAPTEPETEEPTEEITETLTQPEAPTEALTSPAEDEDTDAPQDTADGTAAPTEPAPAKGCSSVLWSGALGLLMTLTAAFAVCRKKNDDR